MPKHILNSLKNDVRTFTIYSQLFQHSLLYIVSIFSPRSCKLSHYFKGNGSFTLVTDHENTKEYLNM